MPKQVWDEMTYPFPNFNGCTVEVLEWISNFIPHIILDVITHPLFTNWTGEPKKKNATYLQDVESLPTTKLLFESQS